MLMSQPNSNVPIWLFCNVYVVADNDVTIAGRARTATRRFHWLQEKNYLHNI